MSLHRSAGAHAARIAAIAAAGDVAGFGLGIAGALAGAALGTQLGGCDVIQLSSTPSTGCVVGGFIGFGLAYPIGLAFGAHMTAALLGNDVSLQRTISGTALGLVIAGALYGAIALADGAFPRAQPILSNVALVTALVVPGIPVACFNELAGADTQEPIAIGVLPLRDGARASVSLRF